MKLELKISIIVIRLLTAILRQLTAPAPIAGRLSPREHDLVKEASELCDQIEIDEVACPKK